MRDSRILRILSTNRLPPFCLPAAKRRYNGCMGGDGARTITSHDASQRQRSNENNSMRRPGIDEAFRTAGTRRPQTGLRRTTPCNSTMNIAYSGFQKPLGRLLETGRERQPSRLFKKPSALAAECHFFFGPGAERRGKKPAATGAHQLPLSRRCGSRAAAIAACLALPKAALSTGSRVGQARFKRARPTLQRAKALANASGFDVLSKKNLQRSDFPNACKTGPRHLCC